MRDIAAEAVLIAGGGAAILLQAADPRIARGVARHSDFASRPLDRLHATLRYVYVQVYGTSAERHLIARRVGRAHSPVRGGAEGGVAAYSASDDDLQLWVAATLYRTAITLAERLVGPLSDRAAETVYREYAVLGTALGMPRRLWPADRAAFEAWWRQREAALQVGDEARGVARDLLHPHHVPIWLRALMPLVRLVTAGLLPARLREEYALPWSERRQRRFDRLLRATRRIWPMLPPGIRHLPAIVYLRQVRRRS